MAVETARQYVLKGYPLPPDGVRRCTAGGGSRSFLFRDMAGGAGSYGSRMPYDPGDAMGVLIHVACVMLGPTPTRQFSVKKEFFLMTHQLLTYFYFHGN